MKPIILLDMDGVIADYVSGALISLGLDINTPITDMEMAECLGITKEEFYAPQMADPDFWINLKPYPWMNELVDLVRSHGEVYIATAPNRHRGVGDKIEWCRQHLGDWTQGKVMVGKPKYLLAGPGRTLIDDHPENCEKFIEYGGNAILFPRPWNANNNPVKDWREAIKQIGKI
jgi:5'(3')-deoxyribonucleotidase